MEISIVPEKLFQLGPISVTNSLFSGLIIVILMAALLVYFATKIRGFKPSKTQLLFEIVFDYIFEIANSIIGKQAKSLFPFLFTFFLFVVLSNWFGLLPFVGPVSVIHSEQMSEIQKDESLSNISETVKIGDVKGAKVNLIDCFAKRDCYLSSDLKIIESEKAFPLFRAPTSDISATLALALISVIFTNIFGFSHGGINYLKKYLNFSSPIDFFIGILELVTELGKILSFAFRLFGNVFAGEVLLLVITSLSYGLATLPFLGLELFVGLIQGFVFFMLTTVFIGLAVKHE